MPFQEVKLYQVGTSVVGNRLLDPGARTVQARMGRSNSLTSGHRACQGCGDRKSTRLNSVTRPSRMPSSA